MRRSAIKDGKIIDKSRYALDGIPVPFLGREALVQNKRAAGRLKERGDLEALGESN